MISVHQGKYMVSNTDEDVMGTVLGSCVAACIYDPFAKVGGMNHFLLPEAGSHASSNIVYGAQAMELLINGLMKLGSRKESMQAKLFGGGKVIDNLCNVGAANVEFAVRFMKDESIPLVGHCLGGTHARRVKFWPASGRVLQRKLENHQLNKTIEAAPAKPAPDVVLF